MQVVTLEVREVTGEIVVASLDQVHRGLIKVSEAVSVFPQTKPPLAVAAVPDYSQAVHLTLVPPASVGLPLPCPCKRTIAALIILNVRTFVAISIRTDINAVTMHHSFTPVTIVLASVTPNVDPVTVVLIRRPLAVVASSVGPCVNSSALFLVLVKSAFVLAFLPAVYFNTLTLLHVVHPVTAVLFSRAFLLVDALSVELVTAEGSIIDIAR